ncbi:hypothetical protein L873DRAFT_1745982, partial [Choiromyces venosus 120613-1]
PKEAFCILLYWLSYPDHLKYCLKIFGYSKTRLAVVFNDIIIYLVAEYTQTLVWD